MKKILFIFALLLIMTSCNSQGKRPLMGDTDYQKELNASYKDASKSPPTIIVATVDGTLSKC